MEEGPTVVPSPSRTTEGDISLFEILTPLVRWRKLIAVTALLCTAATVAVLLFLPPVYTGETTFTPETAQGSGGGGGLGGLIGLAGQLGISIGGFGSNGSPEFFSALLKSPGLLRATLNTEFPDPDQPDRRRPLLDILRIKGDSPEARLQRGTQALAHLTQTSVDQNTSIVTLRVKMPSRELAAAVANRMVNLLNTFNLESRQSQSRKEREFTEQRLAQAKDELQQAEQAQLRFLEANRSYRTSPALMVEADRLEREVELKNDVFVTLNKAYEEARIAEVRDTPVLTVIDSAIAPVRRTSPRPVLGAMIALVLGTALGIVLAYVRAARTRAPRTLTPEYLEFQAAWAEATGRGRRS